MRLEPKEQAVYDIVVAKGPVTPVDIAKALGITSMIAAAILSTLNNRGFVYSSKMKYGTSKLYYVSGQDSKVREILKSTLSQLQLKAVDLLRDSRIILDSELTPQLRLFLSEVPDFAKKLEVSFGGNNFVIWVYWNVTEDEIKEFIESKFVKKENKETHEVGEEAKEEHQKEETQEPKDETKGEKFNKEENNEIEEVVKEAKKEEIKKPEKKVIHKKKQVEVEPIGFVKDALSKFNFDIVKKKIKKHEAELVVKLKNPISDEEVIIWIKPNAAESDLMKAYIKSIEKKKRVYVITNSELKNKFEEFVKIIKI